MVWHTCIYLCTFSKKGTKHDSHEVCNLYSLKRFRSCKNILERGTNTRNGVCVCVCVGVCVCVCACACADLYISFYHVALRKDSGSWFPLTGLQDGNYWMHRTLQNFSGQVISQTQGPLPQCFLTAGPRSGVGSWNQLYQAARVSPGICHFIFLRIFHE